MTITQKLRRLAAFEGNRWRNEFDKSDYIPRGPEREFYVGGAMAENARLQPLIEALIACAEVAKCDDPKHAPNGDTVNCGECEVCEALTALEKLSGDGV